MQALQNQLEQTKLKREEIRNLAVEIKQQNEQLNEELQQIDTQTKDINPE